MTERQAEFGERETDLLVVGSGAAGLTAALTAASGGARVVVLEKTGLIGGTSAVSGGAVWAPMNRHMPALKVEDSREDAFNYLMSCSQGEGDETLIAALVDNGKLMVNFLESEGAVAFTAYPPVGGRMDYRYAAPGAKRGGRTLDPGRFATAEISDWVTRLRRGRSSVWSEGKFDYYAKSLHARPPSGAARSRPWRESDPAGEFVGGGASLIGQLLRSCLRHGVAIIADTPGSGLIVEDGKVTGVEALSHGEVVSWRAKGVVLATGGFSQNMKLRREWIERPFESSCEIDANQGDGHLMGLAVGAAVQNIGDGWWVPHVDSTAGEDDAHTNIAGTREERSVPHTLMINRLGNRFMNESVNYYDAGVAFGLSKDSVGPVHLIFDAQGRDRYAILEDLARVDDAAGVNGVVSADSIEGLAAKIGVPAATLTTTIERFNGFARSGDDLDFGRGANPWDIAWGDPNNRPNPALGSVERTPFYAVRLRLGALATKGGLKINAAGQVIAAASSAPIPGLYAAGNASAGAVPNAYPGAGATLGAAMTFGYIIGRQFGRAGAD